MKEEYRNIQLEAVALWKEKEAIPFKEKLDSLAFSKILYSPLSRKRNYPRLGYYDPLIDFASNVVPVKKVQEKKPKKGFYMEYCFVGEELKLVKYVEDDYSGLIMYVEGKFIYELGGPRRELHCLHVLEGNVQTSITSRGLFVRYIEKLAEGEYRYISCDLFSYYESIYEKKGRHYLEKEVLERVLKSKEEISRFNEEINHPHPFPQKTIDWGYKTLEEAGFEKL